MILALEGAKGVDEVARRSGVGIQAGLRAALDGVAGFDLVDAEEGWRIALAQAYDV